MNRRVEIVHRLRADGRLREHEVHRRQRVAGIAAQDLQERRVRVARLQMLGINERAVLIGKPLQGRRRWRRFKSLVRWECNWCIIIVRNRAQ